MFSIISYKLYDIKIDSHIIYDKNKLFKIVFVCIHMYNSSNLKWVFQAIIAICPLIQHKLNCALISDILISQNMISQKYIYDFTDYDFSCRL